MAVTASRTKVLQTRGVERRGFMEDSKLLNLVDKTFREWLLARIRELEEGGKP